MKREDSMLTSGHAVQHQSRPAPLKEKCGGPHRAHIVRASSMAAVRMNPNIPALVAP